MPVSQLVFAFFIMFGSGPMSLRRKFVLLGRFPVRVVHVFLPLKRNYFSDGRKTWSRLPYRRRGIHCLPTGFRRHASTRKGFPQTSPKRLCHEPWSEVHLPQHRKAT